MAEGNSGRVEAHTVLMGLGMGSTPERIAEIEQRARQVEKLTRPKPAEPFSSVLERQTTKASADVELSEKEQKLRALPKNGPRPALVHPAQREVFGREEKSEEPIVLKG